jgi:hypothetical protein
MPPWASYHGGVAIHRALLLIADIGGYTRFMSVHRINLTHAQNVVAQLLEAILDAAGPFKLAKLEGDAAFLYAKVSDDDATLSSVSEQVARIRQAFLARRHALELDRLCSCDACVQAAQLNLKFVAHLGEVAEQRVKKNRELAGVAVITVHRLLKNSVPVPEYVLMTDEVHAHLPAELQAATLSQTEELEGLGATRTWYLDLAGGLGAWEPSSGTAHTAFPRRVFAWLLLCWRSLPYFLHLKEPCQGFQNLGEIGGEGKALPAQTRLE